MIQKIFILTVLLITGCTTSQQYPVRDFSTMTIPESEVIDNTQCLDQCANHPLDENIFVDEENKALNFDPETMVDNWVNYPINTSELYDKNQPTGMHQNPTISEEIAINLNNSTANHTDPEYQALLDKLIEHPEWSKIQCDSSILIQDCSSEDIIKHEGGPRTLKFNIIHHDF